MCVRSPAECGIFTVNEPMSRGRTTQPKIQQVHFASANFISHRRYRGIRMPCVFATVVHSGTILAAGNNIIVTYTPQHIPITGIG